MATTYSIKTRETFEGTVYDIVDQNGFPARESINKYALAREIRDSLQGQADMLAAEGLTHWDVQS